MEGELLCQAQELLDFIFAEMFSECKKLTFDLLYRHILNICS